MEDKDLNLVVDLRHKLHENAELSNNEVKTLALLKDFLRKHTTLQIVEKEGYFYAVHNINEAFPTVVFRADMDAVPVKENLNVAYKSKSEGVSHKCGHDGHSAALAGFALEVEKIKNKNVILLFQPGEEIGTGARKIVEDNFFKLHKIDEVYGFHNIPGFKEHKILCRKNTFACASKGMIIKFNGTPAHAAYPEFGINPSFAIAEVIQYLKEVTKLKDYEKMVLCTIVNVDIGERAFGTSAGSGYLMLTIRAEEEKDLNRLEKNIINYVTLQGEKHKLTYVIEFCDEFPETKNHDMAVEKIKNACASSKLKYEELSNPFRWSEDFGYFTKEVKGAIFGIGSGESHSQLHTVDYDFPDEILKTAITMFYNLTVL